MWLNGQDQKGDIDVLGDKTKQVESFKYLGSHIIEEGKLCKEVSSRIVRVEKLEEGFRCVV